MNISKASFTFLGGVLLVVGAITWLVPSEEAFAKDNRFTLKVDDSALPAGSAAQPSSYADVLSKATPAVVGVYTSQVIRRSFPNASNPLEEFLRRYYGLPGGSGRSRTEEQKVPAGMGSGVIVAPEGYILTNAHVITDQRTGNPVDEVTIKFADDRKFSANIIGFDRATDIAVLKISSSDPLPFVTLADSAKLRVGDVVFAAGNPLGVGLTVTMGIVSATGRTNLGILKDPGAYENFIQTDAAINQGNSGGALLDAKGRLVGINTAIYSRTGGSIGIGFAIPVNLARSVMTGLIEKGGVQRGFLGVKLEDLSEGSGARIAEVVSGTAAARAGLRRDDVIVGVSGQKIDSVAELRLAISQNPPGARIPLVLLRDGSTTKVQVTLGSLDDPSPLSLKEQLVPGVTLSQMNPTLRTKYKIPSNVDGLVVTESSGKRQTIREGVVIVEINGSPAENLEAARSLLRQGFNRLYLWFSGRYSFLPYRIP